MAEKQRKKAKKKRKKNGGVHFGATVNVILVLVIIVLLLTLTRPGRALIEKLGIEIGDLSETTEGSLDTDDEIRDESADKTQGTQKLYGDGFLRFEFQDVGQADCALVTTPNGERILIDTGLYETSMGLCSQLEKGGEEIEYLILSHPHSDHIGGAVSVLEQFDVKNIIMPDVTEYGSLFESTVREILNEKNDGCKVYKACVADTYTVDGCEIKIMGPYSIDSENLNNSSVILSITYKDFKAIFSADAEKEAEEDLLGLGFDLDCDLYKVGHHGSSTSSSNELLDAMTPSIAVISCGDENSFGHPHASVLKALRDRDVDYRVTSRNGNVTVTTDGKNYSVQTQREG